MAKKALNKNIKIHIKEEAQATKYKERHYLVEIIVFSDKIETDCIGKKYVC
jgi:hypothetical protein